MNKLREQKKRSEVSMATQESCACPRGSVGAIVRSTDGAFLILYRKKFPKGLAFVAGHKEAGERPEETLLRETREETGIEIKEYKLMLHNKFSNPCKSGFHAHEWWVYLVTSWQGVPSLQEPDKHKFVKFMPAEEIQRCVEKGDIDPAWSKFIFPAISKMPQFSSLA